MKSFCVLEQGNLVNDPLTAEKKKIFSKDFCDFYRLNWQRDDDPHAFLAVKNIVWSEGRSIIYESVPKNYEYYVFIDDDIRFESRTPDRIPEQIRDFFIEYKPVGGTFMGSGGKHDNWFLNMIEGENIVQRKVFPIVGYDLCLHFFSSSFAELMFPVPYHGSAMSMWYAQWVCNRLFPLKHMCFTEVQVNNMRSEMHMDFTKSHFIKAGYNVKLFNKDTIDKSFDWDMDKICRGNKKIFSQALDRNEVVIDKSDLQKIYNTGNYAFKYRRAKAPDDLPFRTKVWLFRLFASRLKDIFLGNEKN